MFELKKQAVVALDGMSLVEASNFCVYCGSLVYAVKIHDLFDWYGADAIALLKVSGAKRVWVDLKLHDIPSTVARRADALRQAGADILTVHAAGGVEMVAQAVAYGPAEVFAVTLLTSLNAVDVFQIFGVSHEFLASSLVRVAKSAGAHGVVCSGRMVKQLVEWPGSAGLKLVVTGVRSAGVSSMDQRQVVTPAEAIKAGAHLVVLGREVTRVAHPREELERIEKDIRSALGEV